MMAENSSGPPEDLAKSILLALEAEETVLSPPAFSHIAPTDLKSALDKLASRAMVIYKSSTTDFHVLEPEGELIADKGSHEARVFKTLSTAVNGLTPAELEAELGDKSVVKLGQSKAFKEKWISKTQDGKLVAIVEAINDVVQRQLQSIREDRSFSDSTVLSELRKRKLIKMKKTTSFEICKGPNFAVSIVHIETDLTTDLLSTSAWKSATFKPYNFKSLGSIQPAGALHPLCKVRQEFRQIFFEMGFQEMQTDRFVESGFWNFDALFVPQQHPARDLQDTFFISEPNLANPPSAQSPNDTKDYEAYWSNVKETHQNGLFGSIGYRYPWSADEALKLVLRTHTTAISASVLHQLAHRGGTSGKPPPARYFSIDRVFRNETMDATHLAEFHQVEGVIADYGLTLGGLMEFMQIFFGKMGIHDLRFKPTYNPYTEPSMEIFSFHPGLNKLVEIGNSGMFRPEMLEAMGLDRSLRVYGWGLSLERPTMIKYNISNIRELMGHKVDIEFVEHNPAVRLGVN